MTRWSGSRNSPPTPPPARPASGRTGQHQAQHGRPGRDLRRAEPCRRHGRHDAVREPRLGTGQCRQEEGAERLPDRLRPAIRQCGDLSRPAAPRHRAGIPAGSRDDGCRRLPQALVSYGDKLSVFTAPPEIVPLDIMGANESTRSSTWRSSVSTSSSWRCRARWWSGARRC
jgi:hypothetical protein